MKFLPDPQEDTENRNGMIILSSQIVSVLLGSNEKKNQKCNILILLQLTS